MSKRRQVQEANKETEELTITLDECVKRQPEEVSDKAEGQVVTLLDETLSQVKKANMDYEESTSELIEKECGLPDLPDSTVAIKQVEEVREAVDATVSETTLPDKVTNLRLMLENLSEEVDRWRSWWHKTDYLELIEKLKIQVEEIHNEWDIVSKNMAIQGEKLESLLQSFPGVIETATLKALTLRVAHLEELMSQLFSESYAKATAKGARRQFIISLVALGVTIILWGIFMGINVLK